MEQGEVHGRNWRKERGTNNVIILLCFLKWALTLLWVSTEHAKDRKQEGKREVSLLTCSGCTDRECSFLSRKEEWDWEVYSSLQMGESPQVSWMSWKKDGDRFSPRTWKSRVTFSDWPPQSTGELEDFCSLSSKALCLKVSLFPSFL